MIKRSQLLRRKTVFSVPLHSETSQRCCLHTLSLPPCLWFSLWPTLHLASASLVHRSCSWQVYCSLHVAKCNDQWSFLCPRLIWLLSTSPPVWPLIIRTSSSLASAIPHSPGFPPGLLAAPSLHMLWFLQDTVSWDHFPSTSPLSLCDLIPLRL